MTFGEALVLGVVQGLTEFLPVSSSGHLVVVRALLGVQATAGDVSFEVVVHLGTLAAVFVVLAGPIRRMTRALPALLRPRDWRRRYADDAGFRDLVLVVMASLPVGVVGVAFGDAIESTFASPRLVGAMFLVTAAVLGGTALLPERAERPMSFSAAAAMGVAQTVTVLPGISRSGTTIAAGLYAGASRSNAGVFSFLMAVPAILGAGLLELPSIASSGTAWPALLGGFAAAFLSGWGALVVLLRLVRLGRLWIFAPYLVVVGGLALAA